jgi:hypothetical protein
MRPYLVAVLACAAGCAAQPPTGLFPSDTTSVSLHEIGGLVPQPAAGSTCIPSDASYSYVFATHVLTSRVCSSPTAGGVYAFAPGQVTLDDGTATQFTEALHALEPPPSPCGSDFHATLVFSTPDGDQTNDAAECLVGYNEMASVLYTATP